MVSFHVYLQKVLKENHAESNWVKMEVYKKLESTLKDSLTQNSESAKELKDAKLKITQAQDLINKLKLELTNFKAENKKLKDKVASLLPYANDTASNKKPLSVSNLLTNVSVETALHLA